MTPKFKNPAEHVSWKTSGYFGPAERVYWSERVNTNIYIYIYTYIGTWQQSYGDAMVTMSGCLTKQKIYHP